ncbi:filamentous hemagglutinin N-terminal domain-containing protein [Serratia fonticola]|uniref:filamentous hemagglutinin N-terminal domain-containing protein n=1 Tax=Serratia fonticola TaxID=47917 RepID=UPI0015C685B8|nr:filamentous hemagglutinin N-terminal domain-containing protein [Serratia fonticola]NXZ86638.1 filamentous hemagglutinin N-terminal domain-containing protein [Serratia fonticola]
MKLAVKPFSTSEAINIDSLRISNIIGNNIMTLKSKQKPFFAKLSPICFLSLLALQGVSVAQASIVSAPGGPSLGESSIMGGTVIDINKPGAGGVSHNIYNQFDVDRGGVVLNNSAQNSTTQVAGAINGNTNMAKGAASVILNEVNSAKASQLNGMIEVAGQNAQVIIANPSGITCNGCGFINANRATLTTGKVSVANGRVLDYVVNQGKITITGDGLQSSSANYTDLIAHTVAINADVQAQDLKVTYGKNRVNIDNTKATRLTSDPQAGIGLDVSNLGGMYANKITLIGTGDGVGVNNAGTLAASVGDVTMNINGSLTNKGTITAKNDINVVASNRSNSTYVTNSQNGYLEAGNDIDIKSSYLRNTNSTMVADGNINIESYIGTKVSSIGQVGVDNDKGEISAGKGITISAKGASVKNSNGIIGAVDDVTIDAKYGVNNYAGRMTSYFGGVTVNTDNAIINDKGVIEANCCVTLDAYQMSNQYGLVQTKNDVIVNVFSFLNNTHGEILAERNVDIKALDVKNNSGKIMAQEALNIEAARLVNSTNYNPNNEYGIFSGGDMNLNLSSMLENNYGIIASNGDITVSSTYLLANRDGHIGSDKNITLNAGIIGNQNGNIIAKENMLINTSRLDNGASAGTAGNIEAGDTLEINMLPSSLTAVQGIDGSFYNQGTLAGKNKIKITTDSKFANYGKMISDSTVEIHNKY